MTSFLKKSFCSALLGDLGQQIGRGIVVLPEDLAGVLVDADEARRLGGRDVDVVLVDAVGGDDEQRVADDQRRAGGDVVREDAQLP